MRRASLAIFFLDLELGDVFALGTPGTCLRREKGRRVFVRLVSPAEGVSALALTHFKLAARAHVYG